MFLLNTTANSFLYFVEMRKFLFPGIFGRILRYLSRFLHPGVHACPSLVCGGNLWILWEITSVIVISLGKGILQME